MHGEGVPTSATSQSISALFFLQGRLCICKGLQLHGCGGLHKAVVAFTFCKAACSLNSSPISDHFWPEALAACCESASCASWLVSFSHLHAICTMGLCQHRLHVLGPALQISIVWKYDAVWTFWRPSRGIPRTGQG